MNGGAGVRNLCHSCVAHPEGLSVGGACLLTRRLAVPTQILVGADTYALQVADARMEGSSVGGTLPEGSLVDETRTRAMARWPTGWLPARKVVETHSIAHWSMGPGTCP